jgi:Zn finger protein HypA/HybF involved in hydrogenase expression
MKRKTPVRAELPVTPEIVAPEIIEGAKRSLETDRIKPVVKCSVCGGEATPNPAEQLCWVCRRLKISAWRDVEQQMPVQE